IGYSITDVGRLLRTVFERRVRAFGLTRAQWLVIARMHRHPGLSQSEVADLLEIEKASAGRLIDRMQAKGWLQRRDDASDRRIHRRCCARRPVGGGAAAADRAHDAGKVEAAGDG